MGWNLPPSSNPLSSFFDFFAMTSVSLLLERIVVDRSEQLRANWHHHQPGKPGEQISACFQLRIESRGRAANLVGIAHDDNRLWFLTARSGIILDHHSIVAAIPCVLQPRLNFRVLQPLSIDNCRPLSPMP